MSFWNLVTTVGNLWVLLVNAAVRNDTVTSTIASSGVSVTTFLMFFFAAFATAAAIVFWLYTRRFRYADHYRSSGGSAALPTAPAREKIWAFSTRPSAWRANRPSSRACTGASVFHGQPPNRVRW